MKTLSLAERMRKCNRCEWEWVIRANGAEPLKCPKCNSPYWNKERVFERPKRMRAKRRAA